jgi:hypothetical protein
MFSAFFLMHTFSLVTPLHLIFLDGASYHRSQEIRDFLDY